MSLPSPIDISQSNSPSNSVYSTPLSSPRPSVMVQPQPKQSRSHFNFSRMTAQPSKTARSTAKKAQAVAAGSGVTPKLLSEKFIVDKATGIRWKIWFEREPDATKVGHQNKADPSMVCHQSEAAFDNIGNAFNHVNLFQKFKPNGENRITFKRDNRACVVNKQEVLDDTGRAICVSRKFLKRYDKGVEEGQDFPRNIVAENQTPQRATPPNLANKELDDAEQFLNDPSPNAVAIQAQKDKVANVDDASLSAADRARKAKLTERLENAKPAMPPARTKYDDAADEYEKGHANTPISIKTHIATLNGINGIDGNNVRLRLPKDGTAWNTGKDESHVNHISQFKNENKRLSVQEKEEPTFDIYPIRNGKRDSLLVIRTNGRNKTVYHYAPLRDATDQTNATFQAYIKSNFPGNTIFQFEGNPTSTCSNEEDTALFCANFLEKVCKLQSENENRGFFTRAKWIKKDANFDINVAQKRHQYAQQHKVYMKTIADKTSELVSKAKGRNTPLGKALSNCEQKTSNQSLVTPKFSLPADLLEVEEYQGTAVDKAAALDNSVVVGSLDGTAVADLKLRSPLQITTNPSEANNPNFIHLATSLPILRDNQDHDYRLRSPKDNNRGEKIFRTFNTVFSNEPELTTASWKDDQTLTLEAKEALESHVYRQARAALPASLAANEPKSIIIEPPKFYRDLAPSEQKEIRAVYLSVYGDAQFKGKVKRLVFASESIETDVSRFEDFIRSLDPILDNPEGEKTVLELNIVYLNEVLNKIDKKVESLEKRISLSKLKADEKTDTIAKLNELAGKKCDELHRLLAEEEKKLR